MAGYKARPRSRSNRCDASVLQVATSRWTGRRWWIPCALLLSSFATLKADGTSETERLELEGLVTPARRVAIPALVTGSVNQIPWRVGDRIEVDAPLLNMDETEARLGVDESEGAVLVAQAKVHAAEATVIRAKLAQDLAISDLSRAEQSRERVSDSVTDAELERRRMLVQQTQADIQIAQSQVDVAKGELAVAMTRSKTMQQRLDRHKLRAPFSGQISRIVAREGEWIEAGQTAIELIDSQTLRIVTFLPAHQREAWHSEIQIEIRRPGSSIVILGKPYSLAAELDPATGRLLATISVDASDAILPGERVQLRLGLPAHTNVKNP